MPELDGSTGPNHPDFNFVESTVVLPRGYTFGISDLLASGPKVGIVCIRGALDYMRGTLMFILGSAPVRRGRALLWCAPSFSQELGPQIRPNLDPTDHPVVRG